MANSGRQDASFLSMTSPPRPTRTVKLTPGGAALYTPSPSTLARGQVPPVSASMQPPPQIHMGDISNHNHVNENQPSSKFNYEGMLDTSLSLQGELVEDAVQNLLTLPQVMEEVCAQQQDQADQLQMHRQLLQQAKDNLGKEKTAVLIKKQEIASLRRRIYLAEEDNQHRNAACNLLRRDIQHLVGELETLKHELEGQQRERQQHLDNFAIYFTKMKDHAKLVQDWQKKKEAYRKLERLQLQVNQLLAEKAQMEADPEATKRLLSGHSEQEVRAEIADILASQEAANKDILNIRKEMNDWKEKERKLTQEMEIMSKRNTAQVTRLQHQLKEKQAHNRMWSEECSKLEKQISQLRAELEASQALTAPKTVS